MNPKEHVRKLLDTLLCKEIIRLNARALSREKRGLDPLRKRQEMRFAQGVREALKSWDLEGLTP